MAYNTYYTATYFVSIIDQVGKKKTKDPIFTNNPMPGYNTLILPHDIVPAQARKTESNLINAPPSYYTIPDSSIEIL